MQAMHYLTILPGRRVTGWDGKSDYSGLQPLPILPDIQALTTLWDTDAFAVCYFLVDASGELQPHIPRLKKASVEVVNASNDHLLFGLVLVDVDGPAHQASEAWCDDQIERMHKLPPALAECCAWYRTTGGLRFLWRLSESVGPETFVRVQSRIVRELQGVGVEVDLACVGDLVRLFRLPRVIRDGVPQTWKMDLEPLEDGTVDVGLWQAEPFNKREKAQSDDIWSGFGGGRPNTTLTLSEDEKIPDGKRNNTLFKLACRWRHQGHSEEELRVMLGATNYHRCNPPLPEEDIATLAGNVVAQYQPGERIPDMVPVEPFFQTEQQREQAPASPPQEMVIARGDEVEVARLLKYQLEEGRCCPVVFERGKLRQYDEKKGLWSRIYPEEAKTRVAGYAGWVKVVKGAYKDGSPKLAELQVNSRLMSGVWEVLCTVASDRTWSDGIMPGIAAQNGFITVDRGKVVLRDHHPSHRATHVLDADLNLGEPKLWLHSLREMFASDQDAEGKIQTLGEFIGACLMGQATRYQQGMILFGGGANGKSVVQEVISYLFPEGTVTAIPPQEMGQEYRRAMLSDSLINIVNEMPEADILNSEHAKAILSGDIVVGREIREAPYSFRPIGGQLYSANDLPAVRDVSQGWWRRWIILAFNRTFEKHEQDRNLADKLKAEVGPIVCWALRCYVNLQERGSYQVTESSEKALAQWRSDADPLNLFLEERVSELDPEGKVTWTLSSVVYQQYRKWCEVSGHRPFSLRKFGIRMRGRMTHKKTSSGQAYKVYVRPHILTLIQGGL